LARLTDKVKEREYLFEVGGISILIDWLHDEWSSFPRVQEAAIDALSSMCKSSSDIAIMIARSEGVSTSVNLVYAGNNVVSSLSRMLQDKRPSMRLSACTWFVLVC
jgi:hypothetical protein